MIDFWIVIIVFCVLNEETYFSNYYSNDKFTLKNKTQSLRPPVLENQYFFATGSLYALLCCERGRLVKLLTVVV